MRLRQAIPRFSLRTLVVFLLLVTSGVGLWWHWEAWPEDPTTMELEPPDLSTDRRRSPDGSRWLDTVSGQNAAVIRWAGGENRTIILRGHSGEVTQAAFSADGSRIVTASVDRSVRIWDAGTGRELLVLPLPEGNYQQAIFSADGDKILTTSDNEAGLWDAKTGRKLATFTWDFEETDGLYPLTSVTAPPWLALSPDGARVAVSFGGTTGLIWEASQPKKPLAVTGPAYVFDFSPDGSRLLGTDDNEVACIWDARNGHLLARLGDANLKWNSGGLAFIENGRAVRTVNFSPEHDGADVWKRRRPEWWWGVFWLWEFWLTVAFAGLFVWSVVRDRRALRKEAA